MNHDAPDFRVLSPDRPILPNVRPPTALIADVRPIASNAHNAFVRARAEPRERSAVLERIGKLREENEQSTKRKSPLLPPVPGCPVAQLPPCPCWSLPGFARNSPHRRAAFSCVCRACAEEIKLVAAEQNNSQKCPICRKPSDFIKLK
ncbi:hypothetical protein PRIPAC_86325 [Pristionchus pacificus]|uniref:Uncharacterized protein n=1 Tax=Pristionchus pacificus TaxID=54126 RepID=A0A2A6BNB4_PRIPA|nr:hypothetical protein PRIPAC_86325 [Pristionchus pacificus]|eukprot:PDM67452.1 hypothetical protein PRIPAC_48869 [Pristionchus pacificus]